ncbi:hypothetical protein FRB95_014304 [Tulasnella sp. JGI-2019a]|nr:hypothetical protein FRB95_014304 [Tulasnella sp. JGI-2019a]
MTKSQKHKKTRVADFSKAKLKLGKGKKPANNATDTSFKARSIGLPNQTITTDRDDAQPTTRRNLTLADLMIQIKHYSANVRKDALTGLRELLEIHPGMLHTNLNTIINGTSRTIGDEDSGVRKSLLQLYDVVFTLVSTDVLLPHAAPILLHATSALSHIFREIRIDSINFLDLLMKYAPRVFLRSKQRVLDGYLSLLNLRGKTTEDQASSLQSPASLVLSTTSKLMILRSMARFLKITLGGSDSSTTMEDGAACSPRQIPTWFFRPSFLTENAYQCFVQAISPPPPLLASGRTVRWQPTRSELAEEDGTEENAVGSSLHPRNLIDPVNDSWMLEDLDITMRGEEQSDAVDSALYVVLKLSKIIHSLLISTFLDVAGGVAIPGRGGSGGGASDVELLWTVAELASLVYGPIIRSDDNALPRASKVAAQTQLKLVLSRMTTHFPFGNDISVRRDIKSESLLYQLNLLICELSSLALLHVEIMERQPELSDKNGHQLEGNAGHVTEWIVKVLRGQNVTAAQPMGQHLPASGYAALLPTIWSLVNDARTGNAMRTDQQGEPGGIILRQRQVWGAVVDHGNRASTTSAVKKLAVEFIGRVYLVSRQRQH